MDSKFQFSAKWYWVALALTFILYLRFGYQVGLEDGSEFLPFVKKLKHPDLYPLDLFVQSMNGMVWNERTIFSFFFSIFDNLDLAGFIAHFCLSFLLSLGVLVLSDFVLKDVMWSSGTALIILIILHNIDLGGTTLHYNNIQGENFANTFGVWALVAIVYQKELFSLILLILATLFHPLIGLQLFLSFSSAYFMTLILSKEYSKLKYWGAGLIIYGVCVGWLIYKIFVGHKGAHNSISDIEFMNLTYYFSLSVHYTPHYFSKKGYLLHAFLLIVGIYYNKNNLLFFKYLLIVLFLGYLLYTIGYYNSNFLITSSWWFRTTMWLKLIGIISLVALLKDVVSDRFSNYFLALTIGLTLFLIVINYKSEYRIYPWTDARKVNQEIDIALECKKITRINSLFIHPFFFTALKYYGERSSYVEYHRIIRSRQEIQQWYNRLFTVYKLDRKTQLHKNPNFYAEMNANYNQISDLQLLELKKEGVTHVIFDNNHNTAFKVLYQNQKYKLVLL